MSNTYATTQPKRTMLEAETLLENIFIFILYG
jgi:hypothetical protein